MSRDLDAQIAELMGWDGCHDISRVDGDSWYSYCRNCGEGGSGNGKIMMWDFGDPPIPGCKGYPPYSTDIAAAWQVVEKMREDDFWMSMTYKEVYIDPGLITQTVYEVTFRCIRAGTRGYHTEQADTAPEAICLAALKAVADGGEGLA